MQAETLCDTPVHVEAKALVDMMADMLLQMQTKTICDTLVKRESKAIVELLVHIVVDNLAETKAKTLGHTVVEVKALTLVNRMIHT